LTGFSEQARVHQMPVLTFVNAVREPYDLITVDPPYADPDILATLEAIGRSGAVQDGTLVALGHWPRLALPEVIGRMERLRGRCLGDSCYAVFDVMIPEAEE
jgi:16S rRNA (guanine966-N2)-methyltransferase